MSGNIVKWELLVCWIVMSRISARVVNFSLSCSKWRKVKLLNNGHAFFTRVTCVKSERLVVVLNWRISGVNHEDKVLFRRNVGSWVIKVRDANSLGLWSVVIRPHKKREELSALINYLPNSNVPYIGRSIVPSQEICGHHVFHDVHDAYVDETYVIGFFKCSNIAQETLHLVSERLFSTQSSALDLLSILTLSPELTKCACRQAETPTSYAVVAQPISCHLCFFPFPQSGADGCHRAKRLNRRLLATS